ncbi:MAG: peptidoglycan glycosyltransferase, partial [Clostridiales bacterium]|nr:peptidoglycan glycosyltransferase [Clostridiales bacterium]
MVLVILGLLIFLTGRLTWIMIFRSEFYGQKAEDLHERERSIKAARGEILDRNGVVLASNQSVCTISVIHAQIEDAETVIRVLSEELGLSEDAVRERVEKVSSIERIKTNVSKETGDAILACDLAGVKVDVDYKRYYPYDELASRVIGFTGSDNQGILGLEVMYDEYLSGTAGKILTLTDASGIEIEAAGERRQEPVSGNNLVTSLDYNIQCYVQQAAETVLEEKEADAVSIILMNPQNGEILAMVNVPEYNLNDPFILDTDIAETLTDEEEQDLLNEMWRNPSVSDTYEPGSTFKVITTAAALEENLVSLDESFYCPGYKL